MLRFLLAAALAAGLAAHLPVAQAQVSSRTYAPENLRTLSVPDRIRVLESEYREQSNGRPLPRDQRDFYLAQINSGWTFSRIKSDMAESLRGGDGGWDNGGGWDDDDQGGWRPSGAIVKCESVGGRYTECRSGFNGRARVHKRLSRGECTEGHTWGQRRGLIWVDQGCRAEFAETSQGWGGNQNSDYNITCSSRDGNYVTCAWQDGYGRPTLIEQLSRGECVEGRTWGYRRGNVWVDRGCRGRFAPARY